MRNARILLALATLGPFGCSNSPEDDTHGYVKVEFRRSDSETTDPYEGTAQVRIQMAYESCYQAFYAANPNYAIDGVDGAPVFGTEADGGEGWRDRLCTETVSGRAACEVSDFQQILEGASRLSVTYNLLGDLENRQLLFGPLPFADLADCQEGLNPSVRIDATGTSGADSSGSKLWSVLSFQPSAAVPGDGAAIVVRASRDDE